MNQNTKKDDTKINKSPPPLLMNVIAKVVRKLI